MSRSLLISHAAALLFAATLPAQGGSATYELTFASTWSRATHPVDFPSFPHYSSLIGGTHNSKARFWQSGGIATRGIESMAETGSTFQLSNEVNAAIRAGTANRVLNLGALSNSPGQIRVRFTANKEFPLLTLVTMLAPSPDWFVGVDSLQLLKDGKWVDNMTVQLFLYDAGTDSGTTYTSPNRDTQPRERIGRITTKSGPFKDRPGPVGSFTLKRLHSSLVFGCDVNPADSMTVSGSPQIGQTATLRFTDPTKSLKSPGASAIALSPAPAPNFPCGVRVANLGLAANTAGEVLLGLPISVLAGPAWTGSAISVPFAIPNTSDLVGVKVYMQAILANAQRAGVTDAVELVIGR